MNATEYSPAGALFYTETEMREILATGTYAREGAANQKARRQYAKWESIQDLPKRRKKDGYWHTIVRDLNGNIVDLIKESN